MTVQILSLGGAKRFGLGSLRAPSRDITFSDEEGMTIVGNVTMPTADTIIFGPALDTDSLAGKLYVAAPAVGVLGLAGGALLYFGTRKKTLGIGVGVLGLVAAGYYTVLRRMATDAGA